MPSSRYGDAIMVMQEMHWSWDAYLEAPAELVDEITARMQGRVMAEREQQRASEMAAKRKR